MNIFLTGGTGFLGTWLIEYICKASFVDKLVVLYRCDKKRRIVEDINKGNAKKLQFVKGDFFHSRIKESNCDVLIHAGAMRNITFCENNKDEAFRINVEGTEKLLQDASESGIKKIIFISSQSVYDIKDNIPHHENEVLNPSTVYGKTKELGEILVTESKINHIILRVSRLVGPGLFQNNDNFISYILPNKIVSGEDVILFGGINKRYNCIDVRDCASAIISLLKSKNGWNATYNVSNNELISINEVYEIYKKLAKEQSYSTVYKDIISDQTEFTIRNNKLKKAVGWNPDISYEKSLQDIFIGLSAIQTDKGRKND